MNLQLSDKTFAIKLERVTENRNTRIYQDLPGSIHEGIVMDGHRQGKKAYAYKYPLTFLK